MASNEPVIPVTGLKDEAERDYLEAIAKALPNGPVARTEKIEQPDGTTDIYVTVDIAGEPKRLKFAPGIIRAADLAAVLSRWIDRWQARAAA